MFTQDNNIIFKLLINDVNKENTIYSMKSIFIDYSIYVLRRCFIQYQYSLIFRTGEFKNRKQNKKSIVLEKIVCITK